MLKTDVIAQIEELTKASLSRLRELWEKHIGRTAAPELTPALMRPVLAYRIQERAFGGLKPNTSRHLQGVLRRMNPHSREGNQASRRFQAGTRIVREWKGVTHEVTITATGYEYAETNYTSLSPIACRITGTRWSGPAFFGTRKRDKQ